MLALRAIKELEFDRAMGKLSESDWQEMSGRLRTRAGRLMRQLDAGAGYREQVENELAKRLASTPAGGEAKEPAARFCSECGTARDADAKFCKNCGTKL
jgi:membrane protease subunit (stomatin/prohibitin family)